MSSHAGKYELGRPLGAGGMAEVFVAALRGAEGFSRPVAIKRVLAEHSRNPAFAEMFVNEARLASLLRHENIVQTLDFDRDADGRLYIVMELVEGRDLDQLMRSGPLPWPVIVHVLTGVLRGLAHAHDLVVDGKPQIVVHRDVSPHNVLVSWEGTVKVSDFGIAKAVAATSATRSGAIKGKPAYMSPEQMMGADLDGRSDLFAVGVMMWELLTGRPLFAGGTLEETFARVLHQPLTPPAQLVAGLPPELDAITMTLLARDRDQRFQHARDVLAALEGSSVATLRGRELLSDLMLERFPDKAPPRPGVRPTGGVRTPTPAVSSVPRPAASDASGALAHGATLPALTGSLAGVAVDRAPPASPRSRAPWLVAVAVGALAVGIVGFVLASGAGGGGAGAAASDAGAAGAGPADAATAPATDASATTSPVDAGADAAVAPPPADSDEPALDAGRRRPPTGRVRVDAGASSPTGIQEIPLGP